MNETVQALRSTRKRKAIETACERPFKVMRTVLGDQDDFDVTSSDVNNVRAAMYIENDENTMAPYQRLNPSLPQGNGALHTPLV